MSSAPLRRLILLRQIFTDKLMWPIPLKRLPCRPKTVPARQVTLNCRKFLQQLRKSLSIRDEAVMRKEESRNWRCGWRGYILWRCLPPGSAILKIGVSLVLYRLTVNTCSVLEGGALSSIYSSHWLRPALPYSMLLMTAERLYFTPTSRSRIRLTGASWWRKDLEVFVF